MSKSEEAAALAMKAQLAGAIESECKRQKVSQSELARRMRTSRAVVHRLLKRDDPSVTLATMNRAALALGRKIKFTILAGAA